MDFGLAKLRAEDGAERTENVSALPTRQKDLTQEGSIIGTLQHMAPEQLEGKEADKRSDIFAFGTVVYEMVTGKKAFEGKSQASLISAIMSLEPTPIADIKPVSPPSLDRLVRSCLVKDPDHRRQSAHDLKLELEWIAGHGEEAAVHAPASIASKGGRAYVVGILLAALVGAVAAGLAVWSWRPSTPPKPVTRFGLTLPTDPSSRHVVALSPDGTYLAYIANSQIHIRAMGDLESRPVSGTEGRRLATPFFSPDGKWIGFWLNDYLKKVSVNGGPAIKICEVQNPLGASWDWEDTILLGAGGEGILRVRAAGGTPERVIELDEGEFAHGPQLLPDGRTILFTLSRGNWAEAQIVAQSVETGQRTVLVEQGRDARYIPTGHLIFGRQDDVFAIRFDANRVLATGDATPILTGVAQPPGTAPAGPVQFGVSSSGSLVYVPGGSGVAQGTLVRVDRGGALHPFSSKIDSYLVPRISSDGQRLVVVKYSRDNPRDIWSLDVRRDAWTRLTFHPAVDTQPLWTPDGRFIHFASSRLGSRQIFRVPADGTGEPQPVFGDTKSSSTIPTSWSPDGKRLAFHANRDVGLDIGVLDVETEEATFWLETPFNELQPAFSPDGNFIAYVSDETGRSEVYVRPYPGPGRKVPISTEGGWAPLWSPTGNELFYREGEKMMAVPVKLQSDFSADQAVILFEGKFRAAIGAGVPEYDVMPDGQGFAMIHYGVEAYVSRQIQVVLNWFENNTEN